MFFSFQTPQLRIFTLECKNKYGETKNPATAGLLVKYYRVISITTSSWSEQTPQPVSGIDRYQH